MTLGEYRELRRARSMARHIARMRRRDFMALARSRRGEHMQPDEPDLDSLMQASAAIGLLLIVLILLLHYLGYL